MRPLHFATPRKRQSARIPGSTPCAKVARCGPAPSPAACGRASHRWRRLRRASAARRPLDDAAARRRGRHSHHAHRHGRGGLHRGRATPTRASRSPTDGANCCSQSPRASEASARASSVSYTATRAAHMRIYCRQHERRYTQRDECYGMQARSRPTRSGRVRTTYRLRLQRACAPASARGMHLRARICGSQSRDVCVHACSTPAGIARARRARQDRLRRVGRGRGESG